MIQRCNLIEYNIDIIEQALNTFSQGDTEYSLSCVVH